MILKVPDEYIDSFLTILDMGIQYIGENSNPQHWTNKEKRCWDWMATYRDELEKQMIEMHRLDIKKIK